MTKLVKMAVVGVMGLGITMGSARPVAAQSGEFGIGYQFINFGGFDTSYPIGVNVDYAWPLNMNNLDLIVDAGWSRSTEEDFGFEFTSNLINVGGGLRWTPALDAAASPYVQVVLGLQHYAETDEDDFEDFSSNDFMVQPGAGVAFPVNDTWDLFGQIDFRQVFFEDESELGIRFVVGGRVGF